MIYPLAPHVSYKIWGGQFLSSIKNLPMNSDPIGETWEVSTLREGESQLMDGRYLKELVGDLNFIVKFIDTHQHLSVQVHPDDALAFKLEQAKGKTECWYICDATEGAGIYIGFNCQMNREKFTQLISEKASLDQYLNFVPVKKDDFFIVPAGTIHAIGANVLLCEIQQASGVTYRVWDWNRVNQQGQARDLHIEQALQSINFDSHFNKQIASKTNLTSKGYVHKDFSVKKVLQSEHLFHDNWSCLICLDLESEVLCLGERFQLKPFHSYLLSSGQKCTVDKGQIIWVY